MAVDPLAGCVLSPAPKLPSPAEAAKAYAAIREEIEALAEENVRRVSTDVPRAVTIALGTYARMLPLRPVIVEELPKHPIDKLDRLKEYAFGAYYAHLLTLPAPKTEKEKAALLSEAKPLRGRLIVDAEALAGRSLVDAELVQKIKSGQGHVDTAGDLIALSALFSDAWPRIENRTAATVEEIERAGTIGAMLLLAVSQDEPEDDRETTPGERRARAFTLLCDAYDECRRAAAYLRFHYRDAERVAPSLFARAATRTRGGEAAEAAGAEEAPAGAPETAAD